MSRFTRHNFHLLILGFCLYCFVPNLYSQAASEDYIWQRERISGVDAGAAVLQEELELLVIEMLDAGLLHPAYYNIGILHPFQLYGYPGEAVYILSDVYPLVSAQTQGRIRSYLQQWMQAYPPLTRKFIQGDGECCYIILSEFSPRREYFPMPPNQGSNVWPVPDIPLEALYMLWRYAEVTGDWNYLQDHMSEIQNLYASYDNDPSRYGEIGGLMGMARIAGHFNNTALRDEAVQKAVAAFNASDYAGWLSSSMSALIDGGHDWSYPIFHSSRGSTTEAFFAPEIGRYIAGEQLADATQSLSVVIGAEPEGHAQGTYPGWFAYRADYNYGEFLYKDVPGWEQNFQGGENAFNPPDLAWTFFHLRAYVLRDPASSLAQMVDAPTCIGDLYHFQKLATAIRASGTRKWVDVRTPYIIGPAMARLQPQENFSFTILYHNPLGSQASLDVSAPDWITIDGDAVSGTAPAQGPVSPLTVILSVDGAPYDTLVIPVIIGNEFSTRTEPAPAPSVSRKGIDFSHRHLTNGSIEFIPGSALTGKFSLYITNVKGQCIWSHISDSDCNSSRQVIWNFHDDHPEPGIYRVSLIHKHTVSSRSFLILD
jgi:hypothetical protein